MDGTIRLLFRAALIPVAVLAPIWPWLTGFIEMLIDLLRHGEPVGGRRYRGQLDDPLSEKGWRQMWAAVPDTVPWDAIFTSPLQRCAGFAAELARRHTLPLTREPRLMEIGFGEWEGLTAEQVNRNAPDALMNFYRNPVDNKPPGAESLGNFRRRICSVWEEILAGQGDQHLLVVAHAGVVRMILCQVLRMPEEHMFSILVPNAGITRIRMESQGEMRLARLVFHGALALPHHDPC